MSHRYVCPVRWGDMDAQGHVNNAAFVDYLQEARVHLLLSGPRVMADLLDAGVLVVQHQIEYRAPVTFSGRDLAIDVWIESVGASRFVLGYELTDGDRLALRARTTATPYDLAGNRLRRLTAEERSHLLATSGSAEPLPPQPRVRWTTGGHRFATAVRWSDLDSYGHVNNVKYFDYVQEARIALLTEALGWSAETAGEPWVVVRQDMDYLRPLDFRLEPYAVDTVVVAIGTRSVTLAVEISDPATTTVYAAARTVLVAAAPIGDADREQLERYAPDGG